MRASARGKLRGQQFRTAVTEALLHLGDVTWLDDSPLAELTDVRRRSGESHQLFAEGQALREVLLQTMANLIERLPGGGKIGLMRATLEGVARGESIAQIARDHGKSREHFSRTYWKLAANLVADDLAALNRRSRSGTVMAGHGNRVPAIQNFAVLDERSSA